MWAIHTFAYFAIMNLKKNKEQKTNPLQTM